MTDTIMSSTLPMGGQMSFQWPENAIVLGVLLDGIVTNNQVYIIYQGDATNKNMETRNFRIAWNYTVIHPNERWIGSVSGSSGIPMHVVEVVANE